MIPHNPQDTSDIADVLKNLRGCALNRGESELAFAIECAIRKCTQPKRGELPDITLEKIRIQKRELNLHPEDRKMLEHMRRAA